VARGLCPVAFPCGNLSSPAPFPKWHSPHSKTLPNHKNSRYLAVLFLRVGILRIEGKKRKGGQTAAFSVARRKIMAPNPLTNRNRRGSQICAALFCSLFPTPCSLSLAAESASISTPFDVDPVVSAANSAEPPPNPAELDANTAVSHLTSTQSDSLITAVIDANTAGFESNSALPQLTRNESLAAEYQGTRPHKLLKTSHRLQKEERQKSSAHNQLANSRYSRSSSAAAAT
jgi:hypothetical protein